MIPYIAETPRLKLVNFIDLYDCNLVHQGGQIVNYRKWFYDPDVTKYNSHGLFPYTTEAMEAYIAKLRSSETKDIIVWAMIANCKYEEDIFIGNMSLQRIDWINRSAEMAIVIGEKEYWNKGYAKEALTALYNHGFNHLGLHRIWAGTAEKNLGMRKVFEKLGMVHEGTFKEATFIDGSFMNIVEYGITDLHWNALYKSGPAQPYKHNTPTSEDLIIPIKNKTFPSVVDNDKELLSRIHSIRAKNNSPWMELFKIALEKDRERTIICAKQILENDSNINDLLKKIVNEGNDSINK